MRDALTPNQLAKQRQIVDAARDVLTTQGLAGATAREIAAAGPLTKSAIHYYFADMDDLVDRAMGEHVAAFEVALRAAGAAAPDPTTAFWLTVDCYLDTFRDRPHVAYLWFEYWIDAARKGRLAPVAAMHEQVIAVFAERLGAVRTPDAARAVFGYLLGAVVEQSVDGAARDRIHADVARLAEIAAR